MEARKCIALGERICFCFNRKWKLCIPSKLRKDLLEILAVNMGEETQKNNITADTNASLVTWEQRLVETQMSLQKPMNLVGYLVLRAYYYMPSFHMAWKEIYITVLLCSTNRLIKFDAFHLLKHRDKNHVYLIYCNTHSILFFVPPPHSILMLMLKHMLTLKQVAQVIQPHRVP